MSVGTGYNLSVPTPESLPETTVCRVFQLPADVLFLGAFMGALEYLTNPDHWQQVGAVAPENAAQAMFDAIDSAYALASAGVCAPDVPAPFWDENSGDDAPDQAPALDQRWYGRWDGETFLETVAYTFLTGFVATLVGEQAAIKFLTIPRAFRVLIRQNPHGANLLLFLDGGLYKVINGYSPFDNVAEFLIASPGTELLLVVDSTHDPSSTPDSNGNYVVDVIRTRLSESDVTNPNVRYFGTPPVFQTSYDDGTTWVDTPSSDVRHASFAAFPHLTHYTNIECDTAARMTAQLKAAIETMCSVADAAQAVTNLLELILLPTGLVGALLTLFFTICDWIIDNGQATILAAFTTAVYDDIECILFCHIETDGSITQTKLDEAWEKVKTNHPGTVATVIDEVRFLFTDVIFTNAGVKRTETGDCTGCDCGWCQEWDLTTSDGGFVARTDIGHSVGAYSSGIGWIPSVQEDGCSQHAYMYIYKDFSFDISNCTGAEIEFASAIGSFDAFFFDQDLTDHSIVQRSNFDNGTVAIHGVTMASVTFNEAMLTFNKCGQPDGWAAIRFRMSGTGTRPAFTDGTEC